MVRKRCPCGGGSGQGPLPPRQSATPDASQASPRIRAWLRSPSASDVADDAETAIISAPRARASSARESAGVSCPAQSVVQPASRSATSTSERPSACRSPSAQASTQRGARGCTGRASETRASARASRSEARCSWRMVTLPARQRSPISASTPPSISATSIQEPRRDRSVRRRASTPRPSLCRRRSRKLEEVGPRTESRNLWTARRSNRRWPPAVFTQGSMPRSAHRFTAVGPTPARRPTSTVESNSSISS